MHITQLQGLRQLTAPTGRKPKLGPKYPNLERSRSLCENNKDFKVKIFF